MISIADCVCRETKNKMRNIIKVGIVRLLFIVSTVGDILLLQTRASRPDDHNLSVCEKFTRNKDMNNRIESGQKYAPSCACAENQITLDSSFQKMDRCYIQWFFENGIKQQCCYNEFGALQLDAPDGGYLLLEGVDMLRIKESCCSYTTSCHVFYGINQSDNCSTYRPLETVTSWGDPTIQTIDGAEYEFNGHGEYVFLKTSYLEIQARTEYATPNNKDATAFSAFALFDKENDEQIEFHHNTTTENVIVYRNGEKVCKAKRDGGIDRPHPCSLPPKYKCMILAGGGLVMLQGCSISKFARQIEISIAGKFMKLVIVHTKNIDSMDLPGLAGKLQNGNLLGRHGLQVNVDATPYAIFNLSETWALQNENESLFFYNITDGNYTVYNDHHTAPRFLETLVRNLTELFKNYSSENITLFNKTCRNYWNNEPNKQCLLTIARTRDFNLGLDVMNEANKTRRQWEILHNKSPTFLDGMPRNITAIYKKGLNFLTIDLKKFVSDDTDAPLTYGIHTSLPKDEYLLDNGVFNWTIGTGLRHINTRFIFLATDRLNSTASHEISIQYCGCDQPTECNFNTSHSNTTGEHLQKASCDCLQYHKGEFCEIFEDPCENGILECFNKQCNAKVPKADTLDTSWPCSPCPAGQHEQFVSNKQNCEGNSTKRSLQLEDAILVSCSGSQWDISIDMDKLQLLYPGIQPHEILFGQTKCRGTLENTLLTFKQSLHMCSTTEKTLERTVIFNNKIFYAILDPIIPFIIRQHIWTFAVECDVLRGGLGSSQLHHHIELHSATAVEQYNVSVELFSDRNFAQSVSSSNHNFGVGDEVYVKVSTTLTDWKTKMRLHSCYTKPYTNAPQDKNVLLINDGCEVESHTHIISQSTHETKFVFQDFEYVTNDEGLYIYCNATFCDSKDYSAKCVQYCRQTQAFVG